MAQATLSSPIGTILIACDEQHLISIRICGDSADFEPDDGNPLAREASSQMAAYFDGRLKSFDLPVQPLASARGMVLREAISAIPYGRHRSYAAVAFSVDSGPRAIGQACQRNMLPIIIPCHRVTARRGAIGYYSGGKGVETKLWLLTHEAKWI